MARNTEKLGRQTQHDSARIVRLETVAKEQPCSDRRRIAVIAGTSVTAVALVGGTPWAGTRSAERRPAPLPLAHRSRTASRPDASWKQVGPTVDLMSFSI